MIYQAIKYILENNSDFATAIGTDSDGDIKAYPIAPRRKVNLPFCVFNIEDQRGNPTKDSNSQMDAINLRITVYEDELDSLVDISEKCVAAMEAQKAGGTFNTEVVKSVDFSAMRDVFIEGYGPRGALGMEIDFEIWLV